MLINAAPSHYSLEKKKNSLKFLQTARQMKKTIENPLNFDWLRFPMSCINLLYSLTTQTLAASTKTIAAGVRGIIMSYSALRWWVNIVKTWCFRRANMNEYHEKILIVYIDFFLSTFLCFIVQEGTSLWNSLNHHLQLYETKAFWR